MASSKTGTNQMFDNTLLLSCTLPATDPSLPPPHSVVLPSSLPVSSIDGTSTTVTLYADSNSMLMRAMCRRNQRTLVGSTRSKNTIHYNYGSHHMLGNPPRIEVSPIFIKQLSDLPSYNQSTECFFKVVKFNRFMLRNGHHQPRDNWESWITNFLENNANNQHHQCDVAFMALLIIIMSSSMADAQLGEIIPKLFWSGLTLAKTTLEVAFNIGMDAFCALLSQSGRYYQNAERIVNAADYFVERYGGRIPERITWNELIRLHGIGYKTANIVITTAFGRVDGIPSDIHVIRWANSLGWLLLKEDGFLCSKQMESILPKEEWKMVNPVFGSLGQHSVQKKVDNCF